MSKYTGFIDVAENIFKEIYPEIAKQIIERSGKKGGIVLEVGCGSAILSRNLCNLGDFFIYALDLEIDILNTASEFIKKENKSQTVIPVLGNVENIPFASNMFDLVISRGSIFFWEDKIKAFYEIYRVLKKQGVAYIGGGFGNKKLKEKIESIMSQRNPDWQNQKQERLKGTNPEKIEKLLQQTHIPAYRIINDETGFWVLVMKE